MAVVVASNIAILPYKAKFSHYQKKYHSTNKCLSVSINNTVASKFLVTNMLCLHISQMVQTGDTT